MSKHRKFASNLVRNIPEVSSEMEKYWNSHPNELQKFLAGLAESGWEVVDGVIHFTVTSDGTTGPQWIERLRKNAKWIGDYAMSALLSPDFIPTTGVTTKMAVLPGEWFFKEEKRATTIEIREKAKRQWKLVSPAAETACLARCKFSDKDLEAMGLVYIAVCHEPVKVYGCQVLGHPNLLGVSRHGHGHWLEGYCGKPDSIWDRHGGFAFAEQM
jgi:hypothetical protein